MDTSVESLWQEFRNRLRAFVRSRVTDDQAASDVLQSAFLRMHQSLSAGKAPDQPKAWVFAITRSAIVDYYRKERSQENRVAAAYDGALESSTQDIEFEATAAAELAQCVEPLLRGLEDPYREALTMTALEGMTLGAASEKAGVSLSGMKSRVQRGRKKLRDLFETCCAIELDTRGRPMESEPLAGCPCENDE